MALQSSEPDVLLPEYATCLWEPARHYALHGGRGGGKSWAVADHLLITGAERDWRVGCAREIQLTIKDSVKRLLDDRIYELGLNDYYESTDKEIRGLRTNSLFTFFGLWRNPDGIKSTEGMDRVWIEEAARASQRSIDILIPTVRKDGSALIWTWNPEYEHDPVDRMFRGPNGPPPRSIVKRVGWQDNPWFPAELREAMEAMYAADPDRAEHIYGGEYVRSVEGAYFSKELRAARAQGRIANAVLYDPNFALRAYWDLGRRDATAIWIAQTVEGQVKCVDYCEGEGQAPGYYMNWLRANGYESAECVLPHDGARISPDNPVSMSYQTQLMGAGFKTRVVTNQGPAAAQQRIDAARRLFSRIAFHEDNCRAGLRALAHYHEKIHEVTRAHMGPDHDWSSHGADAFGLLCIDYRAPSTSLERPLVPSMGTIA